MDAKDLRTESAVSERNNDGSKYSHSGGIALHCDRNKSYQDIGSNSLGKVDVPNGRPCAVIGPDRVVPPPAASEAYHIKKGPEPWPCMDNTYRRPPEYPHKLTNYQNPTRNISPRQTFQENMQRILVPPTYNSIKINDDTNYAQISDRNNGLSKNIKLNVPPEAKFCDVPYVNPNNNEHKNVRNPEMCLPSVNPTLTRTAPHGWPPGSVNLRSTRMYGAPELYQYQEFPSCAGPRPVVPRPHRTVPEEQGYVYADPYYQEGNIRFKPYPSVKERYPQQRYEYIGNYSNPFHPPPGFPPHKYEIQKPSHPYPPYPPIKYLDSRVADPVMEGYQRNPQGNYNIQYRNQVIHPNYGSVLGNCPQNKMHSYPPDAHIKTIAPNKLPYDNNAKAYIEYDNNRPKIYPTSESYFVNEMARMPMKSQVIMPNYPTLNMHNLPPNSYYKKDNQQMKNYEHMAHFRNMDPNLNIHNHVSRHPPVFSPNTLAISPTDSSTSNDTTQTLGTSQEDCGYVSQSSTASVRSMDSGINRIPNDCLRKYYDNRYAPIVRTSPMMSKSHLNSNMSKDKKQIDVRQFLQMWNEGDDEPEENGSKEIIIQTGSSDRSNFVKSHEAMSNQEQLYVLGLVNVPSEELAKYEHIQKVSKLPENIKGYNSIELLNQFEEVIESSNMNNYKAPTSKEFQMSMKGVVPKQATGVIPPRPVSPLDVEAKISQSVIHKEVGCNFEIKPCSPKMLNVETATPVQNILAERAIEKVANPVMIKSPMLNGINENIECNIMKRSDHRLNINENVRIPSCKMLNTQFSNNSTIDPIKNTYSLQDLESNSGLCLASLPRLDNDIELNFPEVNQQFINANKSESSVLTTSLRDLPSLEVLDQCDNQTKDKFDSMNPSGQENDVTKTSYIVEAEKEFSKLSKYRKNKTNSTELKDNQSQPNFNAVRTDSVIIKNPENVKNYEETSDFSSNLCKVITDIQQAPINLTSQGILSNYTDGEPLSINMHDDDVTGKEKQLPVEIAIDFSLNKTDLDNTECTKTKTESEIDTPINIGEIPSNTLTSEDVGSVNGDMSILPVFSDQNEILINTDNKDENAGRSFKNDSDCKPLEACNNDKDHENLNETTSHNETYTDTVSEANKCSPDNDSVETMTMGISGESLSSTNTEIPDSKIISVTNNDSCVMEVDEHKEATTDEVTEKKHYTFTQTDSEYVQKHTEDLQVKNYEKEMMSSVNYDNCFMEVEKHNETKTEDYSEKTNAFTETESEITQKHDEDLLVENYEKKAVKKITTDVPTIAEFSENYNELKCRDKRKLKHIETIELNEGICSSEDNNCSENKDSITDHTQLQSIDCDNLLLTNKEMCGNDYDRSDSIQSQNDSNSETHSLSGACVKNNGNDNIEVNNSTLLEEFSDREGEIKDCKEKYCEDTQEINCQEKKDICCSEESLKVAVMGECEKPVRRLYGSKEIYSPWIQKLLIFTEGRVNNIAKTNEENFNDDCLLDTRQMIHTTKTNEMKGSDCIIKTEIVPLEKKSCESIITFKIENADKSAEETIETKVCEKIDETANIYGHLMGKNNSEIDENHVNNEENELAMDVDNISSDCTPKDTNKLNENDVIDANLDSESKNINFEPPAGPPKCNDFTSNIEKQSVEPEVSSNLEETFCESFQEVSEQCDEPNDKNTAVESSALIDNVRYSSNKPQASDVPNKKCHPLKRSLSDSALNMYNNDERSKQGNEQNDPFIWPFKRRKVSNVENDLLAQNLCNIIQNNRRNSISAFCNEDNVSFCILIDNSCIITEEENEEHEKMCYTELSEDCLAEIQNNSLKPDDNIETLTAVISSPRLENDCDYSDSFVLEGEEEKSLEESWVEDVGCVETVISDDIAENIEISGQSSPKDYVMSDNDESGVFSSSEHTDKVKYIYGDKMCTDDALFVETLYKTPQMDVNKTLFNRETPVCQEYDRYYDNDSLEKMLSESNEQELSPYDSAYMDSIFPSGVVNINEAPEIKENMNIETFSPFQNKGNDNNLDIVVDFNVDKIERENMHSIDVFAKTQDDTIHSCESSVDNVFTYNHKDEDTVYNTSSSPEVSSTTSEERNSSILLKITNYKGSRISQINEIGSVTNRSSCKFTEDKEYLPSHTNFATNRPLLTKAAQKYIPPLKESIRDLKVKLSLPQHSLMKLKQLKISKDEPKVNKNKQNSTNPRNPKKPKPKFEDVLKSIDEIQFKMHKEKTKKSKKTIPKVVIKKNQNGSHYASTTDKEDFNPDLTGRKWQPWVFIEKNHFIDKMAIKKKTKAIYSHRKKTYVLAEKFQKYKSASSAKFVISPPISDSPSTGLKYTIRLKHNY